MLGFHSRAWNTFTTDNMQLINGEIISGDDYQDHLQFLILLVIDRDIDGSWEKETDNEQKDKIQ